METDEIDVDYFTDELGVSQASLARDLHVTQSTITRWKSGESEASGATKALVDELDVFISMRNATGDEWAEKYEAKYDQGRHLGLSRLNALIFAVGRETYLSLMESVEGDSFHVKSLEWAAHLALERELNALENYVHVRGFERMPRSVRELKQGAHDRHRKRVERARDGIEGQEKGSGLVVMWFLNKTNSGGRHSFNHSELPSTRSDDNFIAAQAKIGKT